MFTVNDARNGTTAALLDYVAIRNDHQERTTMDVPAVPTRNILGVVGHGQWLTRTRNNCQEKAIYFHTSVTPSKVLWKKLQPSAKSAQPTALQPHLNFQGHAFTSLSSIKRCPK